MAFFSDEKLDEIRKKDLYPMFLCRDLVTQSKALNHAWKTIAGIDEGLDEYIEGPHRSEEGDSHVLLEAWARIKALRSELNGANQGVPLK